MGDNTRNDRPGEGSCSASARCPARTKERLVRDLASEEDRLSGFEFEGGGYSQGMGLSRSTRCNTCLKKGHKDVSRVCGLVRGDVLVPLNQTVPEITTED